MIQSRLIGDVRVTRVLELTGPTHDPAFLFPGLDHTQIDANQNWLAPDHWIPSMRKLIVTIQLWVVHAGGNIILIDTGVGSHKRRPMPRFNMLNTLVMQWLEAAGAPPDKVTHVVMTHLHVDHVGWNTVQADGRWVPTFPNARYIMPKLDYDDAEKKFDAGDPFFGFFGDSVRPVVEAGLVEMMDESKEIADCLAVEPAPGHTPGHVSLRVRSRGEEGLFCGDVMHSPMQIVRPDWNSCYCIAPDIARASRVACLTRAAERGALIMPVHFGAPYCGYIRRNDNGFVFEPATRS